MTIRKKNRPPLSQARTVMIPLPRLTLPPLDADSDPDSARRYGTMQSKEDILENVKNATVSKTMRSSLDGQRERFLRQQIHTMSPDDQIVTVAYVLANSFPANIGEGLLQELVVHQLRPLPSTEDRYQYLKNLQNNVFIRKLPERIQSSLWNEARYYIEKNKSWSETCSSWVESVLGWQTNP